ncbi:MAG: PIN domain-containing protein [Chloroflexi bacterium]|nr:PIN domain-containing protein [Chloroflexota bacterium]
MPSLLDINVLVALLDMMHLHHARSYAWFRYNRADGWLTCPLTQNGCIRILSQPRYQHPMSVATATEQLQVAVSLGRHQFIPDDISLLDHTRVRTPRIMGHRQITDVYLLALAVAHDARLVTLDTRISLSAVPGATESHLVVI